MSVPTTRHRPGRRWRVRMPERAWVMPAGVLLVLAGLIGMHGLSDHGMPAAAAHMVRDRTADPTAVVAYQPEQVVSAFAGGPATVAHHARDHRGGMGHMGGLCLAFLSGLVLGLARWLAAQRRRRLFTCPLRPALPRPRGRDPDPPALILLSVSRC